MSPPPSNRRSGLIAIGLFLVAVVAAIPGLLRLEVERDATLAFIPQNGTIGENYAMYLDLFPSDLGTVVLATGELCNPEKWQALIEFSEDLEALPVVDRVIGLTTVEYVSGTTDSVEVEDFINLRPERDLELCRLAREYAPYRSLLVTDDLRAMAFFVRAYKGLDLVEINAEIQPLVDRYRPRFQDGPDGDLFQAGQANLHTELSRVTARSSLLVGVSAIIILLVTWYMTNLFRAGVLAILCGIVGVAWTFALMGYLGIKQNPTNSLVAQMLIPLGAAFTIHAWGYAASHSSWRWNLIPAAAVRPFAFAVVTTMVGFGATAVSTVPNIRHLGLLGIFGIAICAAMTVGLTFPALLGKRRHKERRPSDSLPAILELAFRLSRGQIAMLMGIFGLVAGIGLSRLEVDCGSVDYLLPDNPVRIDLDRGAELFSRISVPMVVIGDETDAAIDPELWRPLHVFVQEMEAKYSGLRASWIYDQVSELSLAFTADEIKPVPLPDSKELIAQYLLLLDPRNVEPYLDWDRRSLTVAFRAPWRTSAPFRPFKRDVDDFARQTGINVIVTGQVPSVYEVIDRMAIENLQSLAIGLGLVLLLLWALARVPLVAATATLINAGPVLATLVFFGLAGIDLDLGSSIFSAIALGIVVDDTGHLIARYTTHRRRGCGPEAAARLMLSELWRPVLTTSIVIVVGFSIMNLAELVPFHTFSRSLSTAVVLAVFGDLVLLPALLIHFDRHHGSSC
jgi:predicted RND superfamily exporter protein